MKNLLKSKNYLFISLLFLFVVSVQCAKEEDSKGNSTTTVVPLAPSNLTGTIVNNQVILTWTDNSTNETGFKIERMTGTGSWSVKGSVATDILTYTDTGVAEGATYTYRVYSFNAAGNSSGYSNSNQITIPNAVTLPVVTTTTVTAIEITTATSGGSVSSDGGASVTARGVVWSTNATPTIALSTKTTDGSGTGGYSSAITGLTSNTTYHIRAYATNSLGTAYGNERTFKTYIVTVPVTDYDGNIYQTVTICNQVWTKTNLNVSHYRNGDVIPQVTYSTTWANLTTGAWCYYSNNSSYGATYGKLYNWYAINDSRGLAPEGWHVPTDAEWTTLTDCLGGEAIAGGSLKETGTAHWTSPNTDATNISGFTGLPGGLRNIGLSIYLYHSGRWWSSSEYTPTVTFAWYRFLYSDDGKAHRAYGGKGDGKSVRLVKD
ncbi:MAG: FISUMP domain-containing protein [Lutibacter sp.]